MIKDLRLKPKDFYITNTDTDEGKPERTGVDNLFLIYTGDYPEGVDNEILFPDSLQSAKELAELHNMVATPYGFYIDISPYPWLKDERKGIRLGTDADGNIHGYELPEGSIFHVTTLDEFADYHQLDYDELKERTASIRHILPV